jgi:hypothetical protein
MGPDWTAEMKQAWINAYDEISRKMIEGMTKK